MYGTWSKKGFPVQAWHPGNKWIEKDPCIFWCNKNSTVSFSCQPFKYCVAADGCFSKICAASAVAWQTEAGYLAFPGSKYSPEMDEMMFGVKEKINKLHIINDFMLFGRQIEVTLPP